MYKLGEYVKKHRIFLVFILFVIWKLRSNGLFLFIFCNRHVESELYVWAYDIIMYIESGLDMYIDWGYNVYSHQKIT